MSALLSRFKLRTGLKPLTPEEALYRWYYEGVEAASLTAKAVLMLQWLCLLASSEAAPLPYSLAEIARQFNWTIPATKEAAELAAAAGFVQLDGPLLILTDPRTRGA